jgi:hypothetical protein
LFPLAINSPLNGGAGFAGKSGRKTANAGVTNARQTSTDTVAHFMSAALAGSNDIASKFFRDHGN